MTSNRRSPVPAGLSALAAVAGHELRTHMRGRVIPAFALLFAVLAGGVALSGLGASGQLLVQGFTRTSVSLLSLALYVLPLLGVVLGASAFATDDGGTELLLAQPVGRGEVLLGRVAGLAASLVVVAGTGFGAAGVLMAVRTGTAGLGSYVLVSASTTLVGIVALGVGVLLGILTRRRVAAVGWALAAWFAAAVLFDLAAIGVLQLVGSGSPGPWLVALLAANPIDGVRTLGLVTLGADVLMGPTGAALSRSLGEGGGALWILASLMAWLVLPLAGAGFAWRRRDF